MVFCVGLALSCATLYADIGSVNDENVEEVIITASSRHEAQKKATSTVQVIDSAQIERSNTKSITDLLAQNAVGFFSEWTPGQTSMNIRGAATDGQGKDFKGQVLVLLNGRRAGTANLSKLSPKEVARIEIVRGPASVIYGSQAIGGVINIILKNGNNTTGGQVSIDTGSWGLIQGHGEYGWQSEDGQFNAFLGLDAGSRDDYRTGKGGGKLKNTGWERYGAIGTFGWQINNKNKVDFSIRTDGVYDVGFRGSAGNHYAKEDRYNQSADLIYQYGEDSDRFRLKWHNYWANDVDDFKWASPSTGGTSVDHNRRKLSIIGTKIQPIVNIVESNELLLGFDAEKSKLRSNRHRVGLNGAAMSQVSPQDNNQTEEVWGLYFDDKQNFFNDRLIVRAGARYTHGKTKYDKTPNLTNQLSGSKNYHKTTWNVGLNYQATDWLNLRSSIGTGFRAPTASEIGADFTTLAGSQIFGNKSLKAETNKQVEVGAVFSGNGWFTDVALFENKIKDRIMTKPRSLNSKTSDYVNNPDAVVVRGLEVSNRLAMEKLLDWQNNWQWTIQTNLAWNFHMKDKGIGKERNTDKVQRMYQYQASLTNRFGQEEVRYPWNVQLMGILRGPIWYDTEEKLLIPQAEPYSNYIHKKSAFWVWNLRGEVNVSKQLSLYASIDNIFNKNQHPLFIALDKKPYIMQTGASNGSLGTSMMGRSFNVGASYKF